jgi:hypothetical protein
MYSKNFAGLQVHLQLGEGSYVADPQHEIELQKHASIASNINSADALNSYRYASQFRAFAECEGK